MFSGVPILAFDYTSEAFVLIPQDDYFPLLEFNQLVSKIWLIRVDDAEEFFVNLDWRPLDLHKRL